MGQNALATPFADPSRESSEEADAHERLRALYRVILDDQERFDEFKELLGLYVAAPDEESEEALQVRTRLNARVQEWIGPFGGLSVTQTLLWRAIVVEHRWNAAIAPWKESNIY